MLSIPTQEERIKIYTKIEKARSSDTTQTNSQENKENVNSNIAHNDENKVNRETNKITKKQMEALINKLTKNTKRQYILKQQIKHIREVNLKKRQIAQNEQKIEERLLKAGKELQNKKLKLREKQIQKIEATLQSIPKISQKSKNIINRPLIERMDKVVDQKDELLRNLVIKYDSTFKPKLNPYSLFMAEVQSSKGFLQRVQQHKQHKKQIQNELINMKKQIQMENVTFKPVINQKSKKIVETQRRKSQSQKKMCDMKKQVDKQQEINKFKPKINKKSQQIVRAKTNTAISFHERLYDDMRRNSLKKLEKQKQAELKLNFRPTINQKSLKIMKNKAKLVNQNQGVEKYFTNKTTQYQQIPFYSDQLFQNEVINSQKQEQSRYSFEEVQQVKYGHPNKQNASSFANLQNQLNKKLQIGKFEAKQYNYIAKIR